ncbi:MAG TPA: hypothetical protein VM659_20605 [Dongiaceae bacterium]|nr:hypothetical protein [Dongiaceae bacterium]
MIGGNMPLAGSEEYADMLWLDVEASGLHIGSYPIEIGWCRIDLDPVSFLIKPLKAWGSDDWSAASMNIHGISRNQLFELGAEPRDIAGWLNTVCCGKTVLSDNPAHDSIWFRKLYVDTNIEQDFGLRDAVHAAGVAAGLSGLSQSKAQELLERIHRRFPHPHRAGPDARRSAAEFLTLAMPHNLQEIEEMA